MDHPRSIRAGAFAWLSAIQFFIAQAVVALAWATPYSLADGYISDLGNTTCGPGAVVATAALCSPWHALMNASFVAIGITMAAGGVLARHVFTPGRVRVAAIVLFCVAGVGVVLVGLHPENEWVAAHATGAGLNFVGGNVALVLFGWSFPKGHQALAAFSVVAGVVGLAGTALFVSGHYLGLGPGGMERFAAYPMSTWQIVVGAALLGSARGHRA